MSATHQVRLQEVVPSCPENDWSCPGQVTTGSKGDAVAEAFELEQCAAATVLRVVADDEVVATEIVVAGVGG